MKVPTKNSNLFITRFKKYPCELCSGKKLIWIKHSEQISHLLEHIEKITELIGYITFNENLIIKKLLGEENEI
mgnify:CR=1 FL=1